MIPERPKLTVIGTGYLGATHAACMAELGYQVLGLDVDQTKVDVLRSGAVPFFEPGLEELLRKNVEAGRLEFTTSYDAVAEFGDVHFLCVGTPQRPDSYAADLSYLQAAVTDLATRINRPCLIVGKSTVPAGTAEGLAAQLANLAPAATLAWNPEFLREGFAVQDTLHPDRLVFGTSDPVVEAALRQIYRPLIDAGTPVVCCDLATAQLVKVAANAFLATKISFINAMAEVCEVVHADVGRLSEALSYDERIGGRFLHAGLGFGGGCLPKDIRAFIARAEDLGVQAAVEFLRHIDAINLRRRSRMVELAHEVLGGTVAGARICVLGAAFKPNSDDIRDSPALDVAATLASLGAQVIVYDPAAIPNARRQYPQLDYATSTKQAATDADVVLLLTEWREFREVAPETLAEVVAHRRILDGRGALDPLRWRASGWSYRALGRP